MGSWFYTSALTADAPATLHDQSQRVDLRYSAELLQDLLTELGRIETHYAAAAGTPSGLGSSPHFLHPQHSPQPPHFPHAPHSRHESPWQHSRA